MHADSNLPLPCPATPPLKARKRLRHALRNAVRAAASAAFLAALIAVLPAAAPVAWAADPKAAQFYEDALKRFENKDYAGATVQLKNAIKADRKMLSVHVLLGKVLLANSDLVGAEVAFNQALTLGVSRAEVVSALRLPAPASESVTVKGTLRQPT